MTSHRDRPVKTHIEVTPTAVDTVLRYLSAHPSVQYHY
jgi:hypothetical protein